MLDGSTHPESRERKNGTKAGKPGGFHVLQQKRGGETVGTKREKEGGVQKKLSRRKGMN